MTVNEVLDRIATVWGLESAVTVEAYFRANMGATAQELIDFEAEKARMITEECFNDEVEDW